MCGRKTTEDHWKVLPTAGTLDMAIADVMDNILDQCHDQASHDYVRQNLLALCNVARDQAAQEVYRLLTAEHHEQILAHQPISIKRMLRAQADAMESLRRTCQANSSSLGTFEDGNPPAEE